jgi:aryl-alcohol dehydrogenase-like predicted oxidoreductase
MLGPLTVGTVGFGTRVDQQGVQRIVDAAMDSGINAFDTADTYGFGASETALGLALKGRRDRAIIATKFGITMNGANGSECARSSREYIQRAVRASLRRLGTDYIDLYQWHSPDRRTPTEETLETLDGLIRQGLIRAVGVSNQTGPELEDVLRVATRDRFRAPLTIQNEYSLYNRSAEADLVPTCERLRVSILAYFPLACGLLTGRYRRGEPAPPGSRLDGNPRRLAEADWDVIGQIERLAASHGLGIAHVALGWLAAQPAVGSVVVGVSSPQQLDANANAIARALPSDLMSGLNRIPHVDSGHTTFATRAV